MTFQLWQASDTRVRQGLYFCRGGFPGLLPLQSPVPVVQSDSIAGNSVLECFIVVRCRSSWQNQVESREVIRPKELVWKSQPRTLLLLFFLIAKI